MHIEKSINMNNDTNNKQNEQKNTPLLGDCEFKVITEIPWNGEVRSVEIGEWSNPTWDALEGKVV